MGFGGGFFMFDGTVKQLPSLVEDFVFTTQGDSLGINYDANLIAYGYHNSLYNEVGWFYAASGSQQINRNVVFNFTEQTWTTGSLARTSYSDAHTYNLPYATEFNSSGTPTYPIVQGVTNNYGSSRYWAHETGVNQLNANGTSNAITSYIVSGDYDLSVQQGMAGDGDEIMRVSRFIPDFKNLSGNAKVTLRFRNYPSQTASTDADYPLITGPFTVNGTPTFPTINGVTNTYGSSKYWAHETGTNELFIDGTSNAITSYIISGDYDLDAQQGLAGDGENIMRVSRFIPDFKNLSGNAKVTLRFRNYPGQTAATDADYPLVTGPFTINTTSTYVSTRVRGRQVSLKIENDAVDESWRYGTLRLDIAAGGRR